MKALLSLIQPAFEWTWKNSLQVALLVGLVLLVQTVLARWLTPRLRYALSLLILLRLLLPAVPSSPLSLENLFRPVARLEAHSLAPERGRLGEASLPEAPMPDVPVTPMVAEPAPVAPTTPLPVVTPFVSATPSRLPALSAAEMLGLAWGCGLLALVSLAGWRYARWCRLIRQGRRLSDPRLLALLDGARQAMGVRCPVTLVAMARLGSPAVFGFRRVRLLLPETMLDQLTDQDLRLLFLHEMAHVRRHDMLLNLVLMVVQFVHWFNPLVWLGLHRLRADRELVCDYMVLQRTKPEERVRYGTLLLKLLTDFPATQAIVPTALPVVSSKRELKRRIILIKHPRGSSLVARLVSGLAALALACLTFTGSSQQPAPFPESGIRHEGPPASADVRFRELARLNDLLARFAPDPSSPGGTVSEFTRWQQLRQSAQEVRMSLYKTGDLVSLTVWVPDLQPLQLHSLPRGIMASNGDAYDEWSFSASDDILTMLVRPSYVASLKSDLCCITNRVPWGKLRQLGGSNDDALFRLPDGREVGLEECQKWLNDSIVQGWMVGIVVECRSPGHWVINAMRKKAGTGATSTGSSQQSPEVPHPAASEDLSKDTVTDRPVAETRFFRLRSPEQPSPAQTNRTSNLAMGFTDLDRAITNHFKGSRYLIDYEHNLVVACGTPEQLDVMENIIRDSAFAASLTSQERAEISATRELMNRAPPQVPQPAANQRVSSGSVVSHALAEPPTLRFLAWRHEWQTNQPGAAWHPDGSPVTDRAEQDWLPQVKPADLDPGLLQWAQQMILSTNRFSLKPRILYLWFSCPSRTPIRFDQLSLLDGAGRGIPSRGPSPAATGWQEPNDRNGGLGWSTACLLTGDSLNVPPRVTVRLDYVSGPLERVKEVAISPGLPTPISVDDGAAVKGYGQDEKERAFITIAVDEEKFWSRRFDVIAVTTDGREVASIGRPFGVTAKPSGGAVKFEFDLPLAKVAKFRIGSRAIRTRQWTDVVMTESKQNLYGDMRQALPVPNPYARTNLVYTGQGRQALLAKLDRIRLDRVSFYWQPLGEVVRFLNDETKKRDPEKRGINYLINQNIDRVGPTVTPLPKQGPNGQPTPVAPAEQVNLIAVAIKINPALTDIRLADVLDAIVKGAEQPIKYSIEDYAVVFSLKGRETTPLYVRTFKVDTNVFLSGLIHSEPPDSVGVGRGIELSPRISSPSPSDGERVPSTTLTPDSPRFRMLGEDRADGTAVSAQVLTRLARLGVDFDPKRNPGKAVFYKERQGVLLVRATLEDLDIVERMIVELNAASPGGQSGIPQSTNLVVRIDAQGNLAIRQTRVTFPDLGSYLTSELAKHPELRMDIQADKSAPIKAIIQVMDAMKQARPETGSPGLSIGETVQGRSVADWVKEAEISIRPGKEGEHALGVLQNAGPQIMPQLSRLLREDESPEIQAKAAWIMSVIGYRNPDAPEVHAAVPVLITAAQNKNTEVRIYSVQALGAIGRAASNAVPVLIWLTRDENSSVRMSAVEALGRIGATSPESIEALTAAASDSSSDVRITARKALIIAQGGKASSLMTSDEAGSLAEHLANEKAQALYNRQPFRNGPPARFVRDHWTWHHLQGQGLGDIEATVEFAADGAEPKVTVVRLESVPRTP